MTLKKSVLRLKELKCEDEICLKEMSVIPEKFFQKKVTGRDFSLHFV